MDRTSSKLLTGVQYQEMSLEHLKSPVIFHRYSLWLRAISCSTHPDVGDDNWCSKLNAGFLQLLFHLRVCVGCFCVCVSHTIHPHNKRRSHREQSDTHRCPGSDELLGGCVLRAPPPRTNTHYSSQHNIITWIHLLYTRVLINSISTETIWVTKTH